MSTVRRLVEWRPAILILKINIRAMLDQQLCGGVQRVAGCLM
jgi:hypothetical protein